jgi:DNA polymerase III delta subunit
MAKRVQSESTGDVSARTRFLILYGPDRFTQDRYLDELRAALHAKHGVDGVDTVRFDGAAGARIAADVLDECRSMGLMSQYKIVLVDNADLLFKGEDKEGEEADDPKPVIAAAGRRGSGARGGASQGPRRLLEHYAADPSDSATLVLRASTWRAGNLDKAVLALDAGRGAVIKCEPPDEAEAVRWAIEQCPRAHGAKIEQAAAAALVAAVGAELARIDSELEKLALAAGGKGQAITAELVETMTGTTREDELWGIQSRVISGNTAKALEHLRQLIDVSRADAVPLTWAYVDLARKMHTASRGLSQGIPRGQLVGAIKAWGPMLDAVLSKAGRGAAGAEGAARLFKAAVDTDAAGKSGLGDGVRNLEVLTVKMCREWGEGSRGR